MTPPIILPNIISPQLFRQYTDAWLKAALTDETTLAASFGSGESRIKYVSFPVERIVWLLSAVGIRQIKSRFMLVPDTAGALHFSIALYAADSEGNPLSAYYGADQYWNSTQPTGTTSSAGGNATPTDGGPSVEDSIPAALAGVWVTNWQTAAEPTIPMFDAPQGVGPLQGYNFRLEDFLAPLFGKSVAGNQLLVYLGLHDYYSPGADSDSVPPTQTFGLLLRVTGDSLVSPSTDTPTGTPAAAQLASAKAEDYEDLSAPCPPGH